MSCARLLFLNLLNTVLVNHFLVQLIKQFFIAKIFVDQLRYQVLQLRHLEQIFQLLRLHRQIIHLDTAHEWNT